MDIVLGPITLDTQTYAPIASVSYEFFKTDSGEIIGGQIIAKINGIVSVSDDPNNTSRVGAMVMQKLKTIRDLGRQTSCITTNIPNFNPLNNQAKITNVTIDEGPDPAWVNQGAYSIEVRGLVDNIPSNSFGIVASDGVTQVSRTESISIGEESHGGNAGNLESNTFIKFTNNISLTCKPFCSNTNPISVLKKIIKLGANHPVFSLYKGWDTYLQSRTLETNSDGTITFNADIILLPPGSAPALVNIEFGYRRTYESRDITFTTVGNIEGLVSINWSDLVNLDSSCSVSKLTNAKSVYDQISSKYKDLNSWSGENLELEQKDNCPLPNIFFIGRCTGPFSGGIRQNIDYDIDTSCVKPSSSTESIDRTNGSINFTYEWSTTSFNGGYCVKDGRREEITVEITEPQESYVEHSIPGYGTLIQNVNCKTAKRISATISITTPDDTCNTNAPCLVNDGKKLILDKYFGNDQWILIGNTITSTINSYTLREDYIRCRK